MLLQRVWRGAIQLSKRDFMDCRKTDLCWRSTGHSGACEGPSIEPWQQPLGTTLSLLDYERLMVLAVKHCPKEHHDWEEVLELTTALDAKQ